MKKNIKKMSENELALINAIIDIGPFEGYVAMLEKGDVKPPVSFSDNDWWDEDDNWSFPMKNMKRMERRKCRFRKDMARRTRAHNLGYDLSIEDNPSKVRSFLSASHVDKAYFRGNKAQKKLGESITTIEARSLLAQMEWEAEEDKEAERKEAERQFMLDELASTTDDLNRLKDMEAEAKKVISDLIRTIHEANNKLQDYQVKMNGLRAGKLYLEAEIAKLEEALKQ